MIICWPRDTHWETSNVRRVCDRVLEGDISFIFSLNETRAPPSNWGWYHTQYEPPATSAVEVFSLQSTVAFGIILVLCIMKQRLRVTHGLFYLVIMAALNASHNVWRSKSDWTILNRSKDDKRNEAAGERRGKDKLMQSSSSIQYTKHLHQRSLGYNLGDHDIVISSLFPVLWRQRSIQETGLVDEARLPFVLQF